MKNIIYLILIIDNSYFSIKSFKIQDAAAKKPPFLKRFEIVFLSYICPPFQGNMISSLRLIPLRGFFYLELFLFMDRNT
ncbi:hypothetical protein HMPREF0083_05989 [Aneurinibacillus aneurinilyticus ATCC 12856]|uniref:Uncharacterized protein n=1 Tax=Aneurinibacillus aneurinilyticus ATCC 12856 TaxID=649747 RepID=U1WPQ4_ANEAE|nr:hypothetical protein HMPREF0083_05989 [Aneurinibacillus aneurinilyticus ATCC 12856]